jgi:alkylation response protein AidB-like acyl-CoA dehydrogenase
MAEAAVGNVDGVLVEVRELAQALIASGAAGIDPESRFPDEQLSALAQAGALRLLMPCEQGGAGAGLVTQGALEVCGDQGYTPALPVERHLRDARAGAVMAPTNGVLRTWSVKAIAGLPVS